MSKISIALATNEKYARYCAVTIASVLANSNNDTSFDFFILVSQLKVQTKEKFLQLKSIKNCSITFIEVDKKSFKTFQ